jgi:hypothetical protein
MVQALTATGMGCRRTAGLLCLGGQTANGKMNSGWPVAIFLCLSLATVIGVLFAARPNIGSGSQADAPHLSSGSERILISLLTIALFILGGFIMFLVLHLA